MKAKFVNEVLNEKFTENSDPVYDLDIGHDKSIKDKFLGKPRAIKFGSRIKYVGDDGKYHFGTYIRDTIFRGEYSVASLFSDVISIINDDELGRIKIKKDKIKTA